mmetsp:Transcript_91177/g.221407  ORF Transcript_91177/g.221407 Transcript_91177/m.221407 type:complete len:269 (-) Transcript_91177:371-1177(-)
MTLYIALEEERPGCFQSVHGYPLDVLLYRRHGFARPAVGAADHVLRLFLFSTHLVYGETPPRPAELRGHTPDHLHEGLEGLGDLVLVHLQLELQGLEVHVRRKAPHPHQAVHHDVQADAAAACRGLKHGKEGLRVLDVDASHLEEVPEARLSHGALELVDGEEALLLPVDGLQEGLQDLDVRDVFSALLEQLLVQVGLRQGHDLLHEETGDNVPGRDEEEYDVDHEDERGDAPCGHQQVVEGRPVVASGGGLEEDPHGRDDAAIGPRH